MTEQVHVGEEFNRRKLFWIGIIFPLILPAIFGGLWIADRPKKRV